MSLREAQVASRCQSQMQNMQETRNVNAEAHVVTPTEGILPGLQKEDHPRRNEKSHKEAFLDFLTKLSDL